METSFLSVLKVVIEKAGVARRIQDLRGRFASPQPVLRGAVLNYIDVALLKNFVTEGDWSGHPWAELAQSTVRKKIKAGRYHLGILRYDDVLFHAVAFPYGFSPLKQIRVTNRSLHIDILDPKAKYHQFGTEHMPARQVVPDPMPESFIEGLRNIVRRFLIEATFK